MAMIRELTCLMCQKAYPWDRLQNLCSCGRPLSCQYDLADWDRNSLKDREPTLWRYGEMLPPVPRLSLGEGMTPIIPAPALGTNWFIKDESTNPTASFKARGMALAVSAAKFLGAKRLAVPSAGNAGGALAAYAAAAGVQASVFMPRDTPQANIVECLCLGAEVILIDGLITDCAVELKSRQESEGFFDLSTLKEPYRLEGKKTMGYEVAEQFEWKLPDVIVYPTGGGTGLLGMWKAFSEMESLGWIGPERPRMVSVQAAGCAPIVNAYRKDQQVAEEVKKAHTVASGLRVPRAVGDFAMLDLIRKSAGTAVAVSDEDLIAAAKEMARKTGVFASPEGGAALAAAKALREQGWISPNDTVLLFNTGSGIKYLEALA